MEDSTSRIVQFAQDVRLAAVSAEVVHQAKRMLLNYFGCALGGAGHESVEACLRARQSWSGPQIATVFGHRDKRDPLLAAQLNGISSAVYSFDDTHRDALVHPSGPVASAILPLVETTYGSGADVLRAFIIGTEFVCRLSRAVSVNPARAKMEWVQTGICGGPGAALAAGMLLKLPNQQLTWAIGLAACRSAGYRGLTRSMCFSYMAGSAAEAGLGAALLAQAGMTGPKEPLTGANNFGTAFATEMNESALIDGLGTRYELLANTYKPYPCGVVIHPVIDACLSLAAHLPKEDQIASVDVTVNPSVLGLADIAAPRDQFEAQMSLQHWSASALLLGAAGVEQTKPAALADPVIAQLRTCIHLRGDASVSRAGARVDLLTTRGIKLEEVVLECRGGANLPMSDAELEDKFMAQAAPVIGTEQGARLAAACWSIQDVVDVPALLQATRPAT